MSAICDPSIRIDACEQPFAKTTVELLIRVVDWFSVDPLARLSVVFDFYRQVTANGFNKHHVVDRDVRMCTIMVLVSGGLGPTELMLSRVANFVFAAIIDLLQGFCSHPPLERLDVVCGLAHLENHVKHWSGPKKSGESCVFVEAIEFVEIFRKLLVAD